MLAGLPYVVWPVGSLFVLASRKKDDPFLHYHAVQGGLFGAVLLAVCVLGFIALAITFRLLPSSYYVSGMLGMGTLVGGGLAAMGIFLTAIFLGWRATEGEMLKLPFLGEFAEQKMLDHTGMTRREFMAMLEQSFVEPKFDEPEPIPFPVHGSPGLGEKASEVLAARPAEDMTPAALKAAEIMAHRQAKLESEKKARVAAQQALQASQQAANLAAQQAAVLQAAQRPAAHQQAQARSITAMSPAPTQGPPRPMGAPSAGAPRPASSRDGAARPPHSGSPPQQRPAASPSAIQARRPAVPPAAPASPAPTTGSRTGAQAPVAPEDRAKSFSLIGGTKAGSVPPKSASPVPPGQKERATPPSRPAPPTPATPNQVRDVDLIRHYKERQRPEPDGLRRLLDNDAP